MDNVCDHVKTTIEFLQDAEVTARDVSEVWCMKCEIRWTFERYKENDKEGEIE